jgi:hypothetical protein
MVQETRRVNGRHEEIVWTEEWLEQAATGKLAVYVIGHKQPHKLSAVHWQEYAAAKERGYVICRKAMADIALQNVWFIHCELEGWPYVKVLTRRDYAEVHLDLIAVPYKLDRVLVSELLAYLESSGVCSRGSYAGLSGCRSYVTKVRMSEASRVAEAMLKAALRAKDEHAAAEQNGAGLCPGI